jgi:FkbM family methyltransferase
MLIKDVAVRVRNRALSEVWRAMSRVVPEYTVRTRQGRYRVLTRDQVIGRQLFALGEYESDIVAETVALLDRIGRPVRGGTLLDIGGNMGITTVTMLSLGLMGRAIAFEPDPINFRLFQHNVALNGLTDRVVARQLAASDKAGHLQLEVSTTNPGDHRIRIPGQSVPDCQSESLRGTLSIEADTIDALVHDQVSLMWLDTQGHEAHVLRGAPRLLSAGIPTMLEVWPYGLARAGTTRDDFCALAAATWTQYWVPRSRGMVRYPIEALGSLWEECPHYDTWVNALFLP